MQVRFFESEDGADMVEMIVDANNKIVREATDEDKDKYAYEWDGYMEAAAIPFPVTNEGAAPDPQPEAVEETPEDESQAAEDTAEEAAS